LWKAKNYNDMLCNRRITRKPGAAPFYSGEPTIATNK